MTQRDNEPISALTHFLGTLLSIAGLTLMVVFTAIYGRANNVVGSSIFGASMILLYATSSIYHFASRETPRKKILQKLDHSMIFVLIAGTYTPVCLAMPQKGWGWSIFGVIWGLAIIGIILKIFKSSMRPWVSACIYITMGWLILIAIYPILKWLSPMQFGWLAGGGILYTFGCVFYLIKKKWMHEIFHLFVMAGSFCHFWLMMGIAK